MNIQLYEYRVALTSPLTLGGTLLNERTGALVRLDMDSGRIVWGEAAPLPGTSRDTYAQARSELIQAITALRQAGLTLESLRRQAARLQAPSARFAWEMLISECDDRWRGGSPPDAVEINALLFAHAGDFAERARAIRAAGYTAVKMKVDRGDIEREIEAVHALRHLLGDGIAIRLDANRAWEMNEATYVCSRIADCGVEYVEEPLRSPDRLKEWASHAAVPLALDETLAELDPAALATFENLGAVILKPTCLGGDRAGQWADAARALGVRVVFSSAFESGVALRHLARWAAYASASGMAHGLDTGRYLAQDVVRPRMPFSAPLIQWRELFGQTYEVDTGMLRAVP